MEGGLTRNKKRRQGVQPSEYCSSGKRDVVKTNFNEATIDKQECNLDRKAGAERNHIDSYCLFIVS